VDLDGDTRRFAPAAAQALLGTAFDHVELHHRGDTFPVGDPAIIAGYIASWSPESIGLPPGPLWARIMAWTRELIATHFTTHTHLEITSHVAVLRCD